MRNLSHPELQYRFQLLNETETSVLIGRYFLKREYIKKKYEYDAILSKYDSAEKRYIYILCLRVEKWSRSV